MYYFFFNDTATTEIYTLSLHDALPIYCAKCRTSMSSATRERNVDCTWPMSRSPSSISISEPAGGGIRKNSPLATLPTRSEEHTSELQSRQYLVCRLLLEKKKQYLTLPH